MLLRSPRELKLSKEIMYKVHKAITRNNKKRMLQEIWKYRMVAEEIHKVMTPQIKQGRNISLANHMANNQFPK